MEKYITYKEKITFDQRLIESTNIKNKFPGRIPVIVEKASRIITDIPLIDKNKFLVPADITMGQFIFVIRKRLVLAPEKALFVFVNDQLPLTSHLMREVYAMHKEKDGFLYVKYASENTFGLFGG